MSDKIIEISDDEFKAKVLDSDKNVLVDFWAPWCGPCLRLAPMLEELAGEYQGRLIIAKINVDNNPKVASEHGVRSIPTLILFKSGEKIAQKNLVSSKSDLKAFLDTNLSPSTD